jgi:hypothetical protein
MARKSPPLFREEQGVRQPRVWALLAILPTGFLLLLIWQVLLGHTVGTRQVSNGNVIGWTIFLWLVYLRLVTVKFVTKVEPGKLSISLRGLWTLRKIRLADIRNFEAVTYDPEKDYGGYGIRLSRRGRAYIASGDRGVRLKLADGGKILIGSQRPKELAEALVTARRAAA